MRVSTKRGVAGLGFGLLLALTGCGSDGPRLTTSSPQNGVTEGTARVHKGDTVTIGAMVGCLTKSGSVTITDIAPVNPVGLKVTGWAMRPNIYWKKPDPAPPIGGQIMTPHTTLAHLRFPTGRVVDVQCGKKGEGYEFAVQVRKTTNGPAGASGWIITYRTGDETRRFGFMLKVKLCTEEVSWSKQCNKLKV